MGLFDAFTKKLPEDFGEYVSSLSAGERSELMNSFSRYGDPNQILDEMLKTPSCCLNREMDLRISENFLLEFHKKKTKNAPQVLLLKTNSIRFCYHSSCKNGSSYCGYITPSGCAGFLCRQTSDSLAIYKELRKYANAFDRLPSKEAKDGEELSSFDRLHYYFFEGDQLYARKYGEITKKATDTVWIPNIQDIIWCYQWHLMDSDASDTYALDLYLLGEKKPISLSFGSELGAYVMAMELKKRVPHLMYCPDDEYKKSFKRNPAELMALAKSKINE